MQNNRADILHQLDEYITDLQQVRTAIDKGDLTTLKELFSAAATIRKGLNWGEIGWK